MSDLISLEKSPNPTQKEVKFSVIETIVSIELFQFLEVKSAYTQRIGFVSQMSHVFIGEDMNCR